MFKSLFQILQEIHPMLFIVALCFLPLGPFPVSPIWILAGLRFGTTNAILLSFACLLVNFSLAYLLSTILMRGLIESLLYKRINRLTDFEASQQLSFTMMVRLIPGTPLAVQNYLLGFFRIRPALYFGIGIPIQILYAIGFIVFGQSLIEGKTGKSILASTLLLSIVIGIRLFANCYKKSNVRPRSLSD